jgi:hypothetical protein
LVSSRLAWQAFAATHEAVPCVAGRQRRVAGTANPIKGVTEMKAESKVQRKSVSAQLDAAR